MLVCEQRGEKKWLCEDRDVGGDWESEDEVSLWVTQGSGGQGQCRMGEATPHLQLPLEGVGKVGCRETRSGMGQPRSESIQGCVVGSGNRLLLTGILPHGACGSSWLDTAWGDICHGVTVEVRLAQHRTVTPWR